MHGPALAARLFIAGMLGLAAYGFWEGTPQDVVNAVRSGNVGALRDGRLIERYWWDPRESNSAPTDYE